MRKQTFQTLFCFSSAAALFLCMFSFEAQARIRVEVEDVQIDSYTTPDFDEGRTHRSARRPSEDWLRVVVELEPETAEDAKWLDEMTINWHLLIDGGETPRMYLPATTTYVDIEYGETHHAAVYVRPDTLKRYFGRRFPRERNMVLRVEFMVGGRMVGEYDYNPGRQRLPDQWWQAGQLNRIGNGLLSPRHTPFQWLDYEFFMTLKPDTD